jgi:hypothetical protein
MRLPPLTYKQKLISASVALIFSLYLGWRNTNSLLEYTSIMKFDDINFVIDDFFAYRGASYIKSDTLKIYIPTSINERINPEYLSEFLKEGDLVLKRKDSDCLVVCRLGVSYVFKIGDLYYFQEPTYNKCNE